MKNNCEPPHAYQRLPSRGDQFESPLILDTFGVDFHSTLSEMSRFILLGLLLALSVAATAQNVVSLANGVKVSAEVQQGAYNYYSFEIGDVEFYQQLKISVVPSSGRSGLYAAYGVLPNATAYTWSATGSDRSITLKPTSQGFRKGTLLFRCVNTNPKKLSDFSASVTMDRLFL
jgi:hypothetical protein